MYVLDTLHVTLIFNLPVKAANGQPSSVMAHDTGSDTESEYDQSYLADWKELNPPQISSQEQRLAAFQGALNHLATIDLTLLANVRLSNAFFCIFMNLFRTPTFTKASYIRQRRLSNS